MLVNYFSSYKMLVLRDFIHLFAYLPMEYIYMEREKEREIEFPVFDIESDDFFF